MFFIFLSLLKDSILFSMKTYHYFHEIASVLVVFS